MGRGALAMGSMTDFMKAPANARDWGKIMTNYVTAPSKRIINRFSDHGVLNALPADDRMRVRQMQPSRIENIATQYTLPLLMTQAGNRLNNPFAESRANGSAYPYPGDPGFLGKLVEQSKVDARAAR